MYLFTAEDAVHTLVLYGFVSVYVLVVLLADLSQPSLWVRRLSLEAVSLAMAVILISNIYLANEASLNLYLRYENAYAFYTALAADIKMMPEFDESTKLAILSDYSDPEFYYEHLLTPYSLTGDAGFFPDNYSKDSFMEYYLGFPMEFVSYEEENALKNTPEYAEMPCYPYYGSMRFLGDVLVVKLS